MNNYYPGKDCTCFASNENECACGADWTPRVQKEVEKWLNMSDSEIRLHCGETTAQEIRTVKAVLKSILNYTKNSVI